MPSLRARIARRTFEDPRMLSLLRKLVKAKGVWKVIAKHLSRPRRKRVIVNVGKLQRLVNEGYISKGEIAVIPGKVLGSGNLKAKLKVAAFAFSEKAREKISKAGGEAIMLEELLEKNPEGKAMKVVV